MTQIYNAELGYRLLLGGRKDYGLVKISALYGPVNAIW